MEAVPLYTPISGIKKKPTLTPGTLPIHGVVHLPVIDPSRVDRVSNGSASLIAPHRAARQFMAPRRDTRKQGGATSGGPDAADDKTRSIKR